MEQVLDIKKLDEVIKHTLGSIEGSKKEIFEISEVARNEIIRAEEELNKIKKETAQIMNQLELLEEQLTKSRLRLIHVNKNFDRFSERDLKAAYDEAERLMIEVAVNREKEKNTIQRRSDMEFRHKNAINMVAKADKLISQVSVVFDYLAGNLQGLGNKIDSMQQRQNLGIRVIRAQEEERHRVAREIHDGPAQLMSNVVLKAEICEKLIDIDLAKTKDELNNLKKVVRDSLQDVRRIIYDLRPMSLDDLGLVPTVQRYISNFTESSGIKSEVLTSGMLEGVSPIASLTAFRIIQEAFNNIKKHSKATMVKVLLEDKENKLYITIADNGVGFDINLVKKIPQNNQSGFGFYSMKERIEILNGTLDIKSETGRGTKVIAVIPKNIEEGI